MSNVEVPLDDDEEEEALLHDNSNNKSYASIEDGGEGKHPGKEDDKSVDSGYDNDDKWFNQDPDKPLEELITWKSLVIGGGYLALCGMMGYLFLRWWC